MPSDDFERRAMVAADTERSWATLTDVEQLVQWISILSDAKEHEYLKSYSAVLTDTLGPFSLHADLAIEVTDVEPYRHIALQAQGRDRQVDSRIYVEGRLQLEPSEDGTTISVQGRYEVTGRVATFGGPMIRAKAAVIIDDFFAGVVAGLA